ncbi:hypothetical protein EYR27_01640 [Xanthomonas oryzae]|nr:hypothetical protein EYR27_01640 [Xanthomonas oryzae]
MSGWSAGAVRSTVCIAQPPGSGRSRMGVIGSGDASSVPSPPTPALRPGPRLRRGRSWARAPTARKLCLLAPLGEGLLSATARGAMRLSRTRGACVC